MFVLVRISLKKWSIGLKLFGLLSLLSFPAQAGSEALAEKVDLFSRIYHGSSSPQFFYHPGYCSSNIFNLYIIFKNLGIFREEDRIAVIFEEDRSTFVPDNPRFSDIIQGPPNFTFHVIYISEGLVFDFDHGQSPRVDSIDSYLDKQFPAGSAGNKKLLARIYTPANYLKAYNGPSGNPLILDRKNLSEKLVPLHSLSPEY